MSLEIAKLVSGSEPVSCGTGKQAPKAILVEDPDSSAKKHQTKERKNR